MPLQVNQRTFLEDHIAQAYRVVDTETDSYFDVYFVRGPFDDSHILTAFVDPVGYNELNQDGVRNNLPPTHFQALPVWTDPEWRDLAVSLVGAYLEYRRTGNHPRLLRPMNPVFEEAREPEVPIERVSRFRREPVI